MRGNLGHENSPVKHELWLCLLMLSSSDEEFVSLVGEFSLAVIIVKIFENWGNYGCFLNLYYCFLIMHDNGFHCDCMQTCVCLGHNLIPLLSFVPSHSSWSLFCP